MKKIFLTGITILLIIAISSMINGKNSIKPQVVTAGSTNYYLKLEGIDGESRANQHEGEIEILSWSWGENSDGIGSGSGGGKVHFQDITLTKYLDKATPKLMEAIAEGKTIREAVLTGVDSGEREHEFLQVTLENVTIATFQTEATGANRPVDQIKLNYDKVRVEYREINDDGSTGETTVFGWDIKQKKKI